MKNKTLDLIKLICAYLVIFIHIPFPHDFGNIVTALSRIAVPLFFISAGYFSYNINKEKTLSRIKHLAKLFIISYIIYFAYSYFSYNMTSHINLLNFINKTFSANNIVLFTFFNNISVSSHLWFLPALIYCYIIHFILEQKLHIQKIYPILCACLFIAGIVFSEIFTILQVNLHYICIRNFLIVGLPYFILGTLIKKHNINTSKTTAWCFFMIGIIFSIISSLILNVNLEIYIGSLLGSFGLFMLSLNTNINFNVSKSNFGKISTIIYIIHPLIIHLVDDFIGFTKIPTNILYAYFNPILICILSTILAYLINYILNKTYKRL